MNLQTAIKIAGEAAQSLRGLTTKGQARVQALQILAARVATLTDDLEKAAGECMVSTPEPGSDLARVISANRLLLTRCADLEARLAREVQCHETAGREPEKRSSRMLENEGTCAHAVDVAREMGRPRDADVGWEDAAKAIDWLAAKIRELRESLAAVEKVSREDCDTSAERTEQAEQGGVRYALRAYAAEARVKELEAQHMRKLEAELRTPQGIAPEDNTSAADQNTPSAALHASSSVQNETEKEPSRLRELKPIRIDAVELVARWSNRLSVNTQSWLSGYDIAALQDDIDRTIQKALRRNAENTAHERLAAVKQPNRREEAGKHPQAQPADTRVDPRSHLRLPTSLEITRAFLEDDEET